ncbi:hypothetical protein [Jiangella alba]|uniref:Uncharacterized protein n=1 Tax=Jiangella alba TaxID=561176 RepID=A0A1H5MP75_9ACTN|nr:hypothetical protein [Jiangella alba]SEE91023.1 hypothetical protein SAMN04488561_3308 [Jiangella alba]
MEWWQTLIVGVVVATVPAIGTAVSLIYQQRRADQRESQRRKEDAEEREKDRQHVREDAATERKNALLDAWREDRKAAHATAYNAMDEYLLGLHNFSGGPGLAGLMQLVNKGVYGAPNLNELRNQARLAVSALRLVAGSDAARGAQECMEAIHLVYAAIVTRSQIEPQMGERLRAARTSLDAYLELARRDLETDT